MKGLVAAVVLSLLVAVAPAADAARRPAAVTCHWVKATKKHKRHRVCVRVEAAKSKTTKKSTTAKATAPATTAPTGPASVPAATAPVASPAPAPTTPAAATPLPTTDPVTQPVTTDPSPPVLSHVQTTAREWSLTLSRPTISAGAVSLQLVNAGEDAHNLHIRPAAGGADLLSTTGSTEPGTNTTISGTLAAGTYTLYCSLPGHEAAGMHATLTVTP